MDRWPNRILLMLGGSTICTEMYGNGARICLLINQVKRWDGYGGAEAGLEVVLRAALPTGLMRILVAGLEPPVFDWLER